MIKNDVGPKSTFQVFPIGYIHRTESKITLEILPPFRPGLKHLDHFSHVIVL